MVLVRDRRPEQGHDPVAGELVHRPLEAADAFGEQREEALHDLPPFSGSTCSAMSIEPLTSANSTVTCLRSLSSPAWVAPSEPRRGATPPLSPARMSYRTAGRRDSRRRTGDRPAWRRGWPHTRSAESGPSGLPAPQLRQASVPGCGEPMLSISHRKTTQQPELVQRAGYRPGESAASRASRWALRSPAALARGSNGAGRADHRRAADHSIFLSQRPAREGDRQ